jgi:hypothetical protein
MAAFGFTPPQQRRRRQPIITPTRARGGVTSKGPVPQYKERESRNRADDQIRKQVLDALGQAVGGPSGGGMLGDADLKRLLGTGAMTRTSPKVPVEPVAGNPYAGLDQAIGRFAQASAKRSKGDVATARAALKGRRDPGADITGSFNAQALGMAGELASTASNLRNQARADFATAELERKGQMAKNKYDARSAQIKNDAQLLGDASQQAMSPSMIQALASEGLEQYIGAPPMVGAIMLGRARYARRGEFGLPPTAWAQAAQYGLRDPVSYGTPQNFYWALGQAKQGTYGGGSSDALDMMAMLQSSGLLEGYQGG